MKQLFVLFVVTILTACSSDNGTRLSLQDCRNLCGNRGVCGYGYDPTTDSTSCSCCLFPGMRESNKLKALCDKGCKKIAVWWYMPSDGHGNYCDDCIPRGCSCNRSETRR